MLTRAEPSTATRFPEAVAPRRPVTGDPRARPRDCDVCCIIDVRSRLRIRSATDSAVSTRDEMLSPPPSRTRADSGIGADFIRKTATARAVPHVLEGGTTTTGVSPSSLASAVRVRLEGFMNTVRSTIGTGERVPLLRPSTFADVELARVSNTYRPWVGVTDEFGVPGTRAARGGNAGHSGRARGRVLRPEPPQSLVQEGARRDARAVRPRPVVRGVRARRRLKRRDVGVEGGTVMLKESRKPKRSSGSKECPAKWTRSALPPLFRRLRSSATS